MSNSGGKPKKKIDLERQRPERSQVRRLALGKTVPTILRMGEEDKEVLMSEAKKRGYTFSLYVNLILKGQEKSPLK